MSTSTTALHEHSGESAPLTSENKLMQALLIAAIAASGLSMIFSIGTAYVSASQGSDTSIVSAEHTPD